MDSTRTPSSSAEPGSPPLRGLLVGTQWNADLRRAGVALLHQLQRHKRRSARLSRHRAFEAGLTLGSLERVTPPPRAELYIVIISTSIERYCEDDSDARSEILRILRSQDVHVLDFSQLVDAAFDGLHQALRTHEILQDVVREGLVCAGYVCEQITPRADAGSQGFIRALVQNACRCFGAAEQIMTLPVVTIFVPKNPISSDFDFDLDQPVAGSLAQSIADTFDHSLTDACIHESVDSDRGHGLINSRLRPKASTQLRSGPAQISTEDLRPLVLRPAPGPGAQSVSLRIAVREQDLLVKIAEAETPSTPSDHQLQSLPRSRVQAQRTWGAESSPKTVLPPPLPASAAPVALFSRQHRPQLPLLRLRTTRHEFVETSSDRPLSFSSNAGCPVSPTTPPGFDVDHFSPIQKVPPCPHSPDTAVESPRWAGIRELLQARTSSASGRGFMESES